MRLVVQRQDAHYEVFAGAYLRWLRSEFGPRLVAALCSSLTVQELEFAGEVEGAAHQDYEVAVRGYRLSPHVAAHGESGRVDRRQLCNDLRAELRRLLQIDALEGMRDAVHHALADRGDIHFACYVVSHLDDCLRVLPDQGDRRACSRDGCRWVRWLVDGLWQFYCSDRRMYVGAGHTDRASRGDRSRSGSRGTSRPGTRRGNGAGDEVSHLQVHSGMQRGNIAKEVLEARDEGDDEVAMVTGRGTPRRSRSTRRSPRRTERHTEEVRVLRPNRGTGHSDINLTRTTLRAHGDPQVKEQEEPAGEQTVQVELDPRQTDWRQVAGEGIEMETRRWTWTGRSRRSATC